MYKLFLKIVWLILFVCFDLLLYAQKNLTAIDSLVIRANKLYDKDAAAAIKLMQRTEYLAILNKDNRVAAISQNTLAEFYWEKRSLDTARIYIKNALEYSQKADIDSLQGDSRVIAGLIERDRGLIQNSIENFISAIPFYKRTGKQIKLANAYFNIAAAENDLSRFNLAIRYNLMAINLFKSDEDISYGFNSIATCFSSLHDYKKSIFYHEKALQLREKIKDKVLTAQSLSNLGYSFYEDDQPDSALFYLRRSLEIRRHDKDSSRMVMTLQNIGAALAKKNDLTDEKRFLDRSLNIAAAYHMDEEYAKGSLDMAKLYLKQQQYNKALNAARITETSAKKTESHDVLMDTYSVEYEIFKRMGNYRQALFYDDNRDKIKDSLFTVAKDKTISELEIQYQTRQKEKDIAALNLQNGLQRKIVGQQKLSIIWLALAALLLSLLLIIAYRSFKSKQAANLRIQTLMKDLHHRVKNNLQILSGLFMMQINNLSDENTKNALRENEARLASMNLIHNKLYLDNTTTQIEMEEYLTKLLEHVKDSFGANREKDISLRVDVEPLMLEADKAVAIGLLINELATNAFKYAFGDDDGEIYLGLKKEGKSKLKLILSDNGKGIKKNDKEKAPSFGLKLVNLMARQLNATLIIKHDNGVSYQMEINI